MDSKHIPVTRRDLRFEGVTYELQALMDEGGDYQATWRCPICQVGSISHINFPRANGALGWAQDCALRHNTENHAE